MARKESRFGRILRAIYTWVRGLELASASWFISRIDLHLEKADECAVGVEVETSKAVGGGGSR